MHANDLDRIDREVMEGSRRQGLLRALVLGLVIGGGFALLAFAAILVIGSSGWGGDAPADPYPGAAIHRALGGGAANVDEEEEGR